MAASTRRDIVRPLWGLLALAVALAAGLATTPAMAVPEDFPEPPSIRGHVDFWSQVFGVWSLGQVVVHDLDHPAVVYAVVDLPGVIEQPYSKEQRDFIDELNEQWSDRLEVLERKVASGDPLTDNEKIWVLSLTTNAGTDAVTGAHKRIRTQRGLRERFHRGIEISKRYEDEIKRILRERGVPEEIAALPHVESSFQAAARSSAGAVGVWQFTRSAGRHYMKVNSVVDERLDPLAAAHGAAGYLADAYDRLGDWPIALTSYNHGVAGMSRAVKHHGRDYEAIFNNYRGRTFGFASKNFYAEFLAALRVSQNHGTYFPEGITPEPAHDLDGLVLEHRTTVRRLADAFGLDTATLVAINPAWSDRAVRSGYALPEGHRVWLPAGTLVARSGDVNYADPGAPDGDAIYVVRRGDNLGKIAAAHGMRVSTLRDLNGIPRHSSLIRAGQKLRVTGSTPAAAPAGGVHVVRSGESLSSIASRYGMSVGALRRANGIPANRSVIHADQRLKVTGSGATDPVHVVRRGDNLSLIATRYGVALRDLLRLNGLSLSSKIYPGQTVRIPG